MDKFKFDFSKKEDQDKLDLLGEDEKKYLKDSAHDEALGINADFSRLLEALKHRDGLEIGQQLSLSDPEKWEVLKNSEAVKEASLESFIRAMNSGYENGSAAEKNIGYFHFPEDFKERPAFQNAVKKAIITLLKSRQPDYRNIQEWTAGVTGYFSKLHDTYLIKNEDVEKELGEIASQQILKELAHINSNYTEDLAEVIFYIRDNFKMPDGFEESNEYIKSVQDSLRLLFSTNASGQFEIIKRIIDKFPIHGEQFHDFIVKEFNGLVDGIAGLRLAKKIKDHFRLTDQETMPAMNACYIELLSGGRFEYAQFLKELFEVGQIDKDDLIAYAKSGYLKVVSFQEEAMDNIETAKKYKEMFPDLVVTQNEIDDAVFLGIKDCIRFHSEQKLTKLLEIFPTEDEKIKEAALQVLLERIAKGHSGFITAELMRKDYLPDNWKSDERLPIAVEEGMNAILMGKIIDKQDIQYLKSSFSISGERFMNMSLDALLKNLENDSSENVTNINLILEECPLPENLIELKEYKDSIIKAFIKKIHENNVSKLADGKLIVRDDWYKDEEVRSAMGEYYPSGLDLDQLMEYKEIPQIGKQLSSNLRGLTAFSFEKQIKPLLAAQGDSAFLYFESIKKMKSFRNLSSEDVAYVTYVGKKYGTQARNILENIVGKVDSIAGERDTIEEYIREIGIAQFAIYAAYKKAKETGDQAEVEKLKERVKGLQNKIHQGQMQEGDFDDEMYKSVSYYSFPPAMGLTQDQYDRLNASRPDRRGDVPESLDALQYAKISIPTGKFVLEQGSELDLAEWALLSDVVKKVNAEMENKKEAALDTAAIGEALVGIYKDKRQGTEEGKRELFEQMYRYHAAQGGRLESGYDISIEGLMKYKEFIGDRIKNDLVKECLSQWREKNPDAYAELKKETLNRLKQGEDKSFGKIKNILEGIRKQRDEEKKQIAIAKLDDFLAGFALSYETVRDMDPGRLQTELGTIYFEYDGEVPATASRTEQYYNSSAFVGAYDELLERYDQDALVMKKISSDLVAGINKKMRKELDKFEFSNESGQAEQLELEFVVSKKREHGVAGYNMGVCVTPDRKLWDDPAFMNCIMFESETKRAMGGMHFLIRENNLCLPGINPSMDILSEVDNEKLFDQMIGYAKKVKEALGLSKILVPTNTGIHSNRQPIQEIIRKKNYGKFTLNAEAEFSYEPYQYSFRECFEVA